MNFSWYPIPRQDLPGVLVRRSTLPEPGMITPDLLDNDVVLGVRWGETPSESAPAVALVGGTRKELFSWISTYAEEAFPLSQFCRVCSIEDWTQLELERRNDLSVGVPASIWPSIILGEMLGQAEGDLDVAAVPIGRAAACFSFAMARAVLLYPRNELARSICVERLAVIERDSRFGRRPISVELLKKIWNAAMSLQYVPREVLNTPETVLKVVDAIDERASSLLTRSNLLFSDSAEDRVAGFDSVADALLDRWSPQALENNASALALAAAAILAGRGTSHIQLLGPAAKLFPETIVWYALLAGVLGPEGWDKSWMQLTKGVERGLMQFFRPDEPVSADICWPEYEWLSRTYDSIEMLASIPRSVSRSLVIELLPGVNCQFRFSGPTQTQSRLAEGDRLAATTPADGTTTVSPSVLAEAVALLAQVQSLLKPQSPLRGRSQPSLFGDASPMDESRPTRKRGGERTSKKPLRSE